MQWAGFHVGEKVELRSPLAELIPDSASKIVTVVGFHPLDPLFPIEVQLPGGLVVVVAPQEIARLVPEDEEELR